MTGSDIGNLAASIRLQVDGRTLRNARQWAHDIVKQHACGAYRGGVYALKMAGKIVAEREALEKLKAGQTDTLEAR